MQRVGNPFPIWLDQHGALIDGGKIYIGVANGDPELSPLQVYWDAALTIPATQPLRTRGGVIVNNGAPAVAYISEADYSTRIRDANGSLVAYAKAKTDLGASAAYQPLADALTTLAATAPSAIGLDILEASDAAAVKALLGIVASLAQTGGTVSGNITRQGAGPHLYHNDPALTSGRVYLTAAGAPDPTSNPGDIWITY